MKRAATASTYGVLNPRVGRVHFSLIRHPPAEDLSDFIERHWVVRWDLGERSFEQRLLLHPCVNLAVEGDDAITGVYGIAHRLASRTIDGRGWVVGTKFRPGGFAPFSRIPVAELHDRVVSLESAFGAPAGGELNHQLSVSTDVCSRIAAIEAFLRRRTPDPDAQRETIMQIVAEMLAAPPGTRIHQLAIRHGISTRTMQRMFRRYIGVSPKWVLGRYRLQEAAEQIASGECRDLCRLAHDLGYSDQSHFTQDFRSLIGITPARYLLASAPAAGAAGA